MEIINSDLPFYYNNFLKTLFLIMRLNMYVACCTALATFGSALYLPTSDFAQVAHHDENYINDLAEAYAESEIMDTKKSIAKEAAKAAKKTAKAADTKDKKATNKAKAEKAKTEAKVSAKKVEAE